MHDDQPPPACDEASSRQDGWAPSQASSFVAFCLFPLSSGLRLAASYWLVALCVPPHADHHWSPHDTITSSSPTMSAAYGQATLADTMHAFYQPPCPPRKLKRPQAPSDSNLRLASVNYRLTKGVGIRADCPSSDHPTTRGHCRPWLEKTLPAPAPHRFQNRAGAQTTPTPRNGPARSNRHELGASNACCGPFPRVAPTSGVAHILRAPRA
jgi:hypothetical protein